MNRRVLGLRDAIRAAYLVPEAPFVTSLCAAEPADPAIEASAVELIKALRAEAAPGLLETVLAEYGLSSEEGIALMCLAEALLRVPDSTTIDALIRDKLSPGDWHSHLGQSNSGLVNTASWALMLTGGVLRADPVGSLRAMLRRVGEPVIRHAVRAAVKQLGRQFVLGEDIGAALKRATPEAARGARFSFDMLGEGARTAPDAAHHAAAYAAAIVAIAPHCRAGSATLNPGISIKLSALHPRFEAAQRVRVMAELVPVVRSLAREAARAGMGFNIDAEEQDRLDLTLDVAEAVLADPMLHGWDGFGLVLQAYGRRCLAVLDWAHALAEAHDRRIMLRLVKGAYWDSEIKAAQVAGLSSFPVWTRKATTDLVYQNAARRLLAMRERIFPQFATHNAETAAAIMHMAADTEGFEMQRLHGMGGSLHGRLRERFGVASRVYAPVGRHADLLAYLVRRMLENGANSSFVHKVLDPSVPVARLARAPAARLDGQRAENPAITPPSDLFAPARRNSAGSAFGDPAQLAALDAAMAPWRDAGWPLHADGDEVRNPADPSQIIGRIRSASRAVVPQALAEARAAQPGWAAQPHAERAGLLDQVADAYEAHAGELMALAVREAGKCRADAVAELREAIDFLRYYAAEARALPGQARPRGIFVCISPWNFPLAILTGQIAAALVTGNAVLAKPAPQTLLIAARAVQIMHAAGVPHEVLHLLPGGAELGAALIATQGIDGVCFTGSCAAARSIERSIAATQDADVPLIAETGGINAMLVDSTALPEQVVRDAVASAFGSAGQRCSALRLLLLQEEIAPRVISMLRGAMDALCLGDPWNHATDIGPLIDEAAHTRVSVWLREGPGQVLHRTPAPGRGHFMPPTLVTLPDIGALREEVFGPVLHVATFPAGGLAAAVDAVNALGYGLTMALHSRIEAHQALLIEHAQVGNLYINRNQVGAVVGSQPFGGERLSGTGPKAGGPRYLRRFLHDAGALLLPARHDLPGPVGETNFLRSIPRGLVQLIVDPSSDPATVDHFRERLEAGGNRIAALTSGTISPDVVAVAHVGNAQARRMLRQQLAVELGPLRPILTPADPDDWFQQERCVSVDLTSAGGNAALLGNDAQVEP